MLSAFVLAVLVFGKPRLHALMEQYGKRFHAHLLLQMLDPLVVVLDIIILITIGAAAIAITLAREGPEALVTPDAIRVWFMEHGLLVLLIMAISYLLWQVLKSAIPSIVKSSMSSRGRGKKAREDLARRVQTLSGSLSTISAIVIATAAMFMILTEVGVDVTPLLATAGIVGVAVGFGAQGLIKDMITGLFILSEDQYNEGDVVQVAGIVGEVEDITLRRTVLRDLDGIVHSIPNGEITTASNYTKVYSRLNLDIVDYPGEWLIDLPLLQQNFEAWSAEAISQARDTRHSPHAKPWLDVLDTLDPYAAEDEQASATRAHAPHPCPRPRIGTLWISWRPAASQRIKFPQGVGDGSLVRLLAPIQDEQAAPLVPGQPGIEAG